MYYIDTSVLAAYYSPEPLSDKVEEVIVTTGLVSNQNQGDFSQHFQGRKNQPIFS